MPPQTYVYNEMAGFKVEYLNRYVSEVLARKKQIGGELI
jgi:hypothetical protein